MPTPPGFATCSYELKHASMTRSAYLTFGIDPSGTDPNAIALQLAGDFASPGSLFSVIDSNVTLQSTRVSLGTDGGEDIVGLSNQLVACTKAISSTPPNCAVLVHKATARGGRRGRGRMYIPWCCQATDVTEAGTIGAATVTLVSNAVNAWVTAVTPDPGPLVILHRPSRNTIGPGSVPGSPNVITSWTVDPLIATQRRRLGR
jgi:hypothetical protein